MGTRWFFQAALVLCTISAVDAKSVPPERPLLEGSAPTILSGLARAWANDFSSSPTGIAIDMPPPYGPPQGKLSPRLAAFLRGQQDFAFLTRRISDSDLREFKGAHGYDPVVIAVAGGSWNRFGFVDPVAVIVNASNTVRGLSFAQLDAIFSKSRRRGQIPIRSWKQLGPGTPGDQPVHLAGGGSWSSEDSARASVFRDRVMLGGAWRDDPQAIGGGTEQEVPERVAADPLAIGITGLGHLVTGTRVVPVAPGSSAAYVSPTFRTVSEGRYPLARTIDLLVARKPGTCLAPGLLGFVRYLVSSRGQQLVTKEGHFLPLTSAQARDSWLRASSCS